MDQPAFARFDMAIVCPFLRKSWLDAAMAGKPIADTRLASVCLMRLLTGHEQIKTFAFQDH